MQWLTGGSPSLQRDSSVRSDSTWHSEQHMAPRCTHALLSKPRPGSNQSLLGTDGEAAVRAPKEVGKALLSDKAARLSLFLQARKALSLLLQASPYWREPQQLPAPDNALPRFASSSDQHPPFAVPPLAATAGFVGAGVTTGTYRWRASVCGLAGDSTDTHRGHASTRGKMEAHHLEARPHPATRPRASPRPKDWQPSVQLPGGEGSPSTIRQRTQGSPSTIRQPTLSFLQVGKAPPPR
jgi:hypothetical protein